MGAKRKAARQGDHHLCPEHGPTGTIAAGSTNVIIHGNNAARVGDPVACLPEAVISSGRSDVLINGNPAARIWDQTSHAGVIRQGAPRVYIGGSGADGDTLALAILRLKASAFGQTAEGKRVLAR